MDSASESELWVICPVCHQANPLGTQFCKHCWGAFVHGSPMSYSSSLAVVGGTVYVGSQDSKLYALDVATGAKRWEFEAEGIVYISSHDGNLYAIE